MSKNEKLNDEIVENDESDVILTDAEGNEYHFTLLDYVEHEEKLYAVFAPAEANLDDENEELSVFVMEVAVNNDNVSFNLIEDDNIAEAVIKAFADVADDFDESSDDE